MRSREAHEEVYSGQAGQRELDAALDPRHQLAGLERIDTERARELTTNPDRDRVARLLDPSRGGRAMDAVQSADLVDRQLVDHMKAQEIARFCVEIRQDNPKCGAKGVAVALLLGRIGLCIAAIRECDQGVVLDRGFACRPLALP